MATKKKNIEGEDMVERPKKKPVRRKKVESAGKIEAATPKAFADEVPGEELDPKPARLEPAPMHDVKPKSTHADTHFLAPEQFSFGLKKEQQQRKTKYKSLRTIAYILSVLILLAAIGFIGFTFYKAQVLNAPDQTDNLPTAEQQTESSIKYAVVNASSTIESFVVNGINQKFENKLVLDQTAVFALPASNDDIIYFKPSVQSLAQDTLTLLNSYGLKPKLQEQPDLSTDLAIYFSSTIQPDLSGLTAAVYNATGTSGLAKRYCDVLKTFKVASCNALNASNSATGLTVLTKNPSLILSLPRTNDFKTAQIQAAPANQVEDIRVVIGR